MRADVLSLTTINDPVRPSTGSASVMFSSELAGSLTSVLSGGREP